MGPVEAAVMIQEEPTTVGAPEANIGVPTTPLGAVNASKKPVGQLMVTFWGGVNAVARVKLTVTVWLVVPGVRLETADFIMSVGSARPMEDAARMAYRDLISWMVEDYGFEESEAYFLATQAGKMRVGNMVDPKYSLGASMLKKYLV